MSRRRTSAALLAPALTVLAVSQPLRAQGSRAGEVMLDGKVMVAVQVTLADETVTYHPVVGHPLILYRSRTDSVVVRTNESGDLRLGVPAGDYRLVSAAPYMWNGVPYRWSVPVAVRPGMGIVDLSAANALTNSRVATSRTTSQAPTESAARGVTSGGSAGAAPAAAGQASVAPPTAARTVGTPKDGSTAVLFSLFLTGAGQMYAGKTGKGVGLLLGAIGAFAVGAATTGSNCSAALYDDSCDVGPLVAGAAVGVGLWIYSMASAPNDVREYNRARGFQVARVAPTARQRSGATEFGLAVRW